MKKIILTLIALIILGSLLVAQDVFKEGANTKDYAVWGYVYHWDGHHWVTYGDGIITLDWYHSRLYFNDYPDFPEYTTTIQINSNGFYYCNLDPLNVNYGVIQLTIEIYQDNFDFNGNLHVDIYIPYPGAPEPVPDNTIPATD